MAWFYSWFDTHILDLVLHLEINYEYIICDIHDRRLTEISKNMVIWGIIILITSGDQIFISSFLVKIQPSLTSGGGRLVISNGLVLQLIGHTCTSRHDFQSRFTQNVSEWDTIVRVTEISKSVSIEQVLTSLTPENDFSMRPLLHLLILSVDTWHS